MRRKLRGRLRKQRSLRTLLSARHRPERGPQPSHALLAELGRKLRSGANPRSCGLRSASTARARGWRHQPTESGRRRVHGGQRRTDRHASSDRRARTTATDDAGRFGRRKHRSARMCGGLPQPADRVPSKLRQFPERGRCQVTHAGAGGKAERHKAKRRRFGDAEQVYVPDGLPEMLGALCSVTDR